MFYGAIMASVALPYTLLQANIYKLLSGRNNKERNRLNMLNWTATILYLLSIPLSLLSIYFSSAIFIIFPIVYFFLPQRLNE
jgi:Na+/proline symporter